MVLLEFYRFLKRNARSQDPRKLNWYLLLGTGFVRHTELKKATFRSPMARPPTAGRGPSCKGSSGAFEAAEGRKTPGVTQSPPPMGAVGGGENAGRFRKSAFNSSRAICLLLKAVRGVTLPRYAARQCSHCANAKKRSGGSRPRFATR